MNNKVFMLKKLPDTMTVSMRSTAKMLEDFLKKPTPREIPDELRFSSISLCYRLGILFFILGVTLSILFVTVIVSIATPIFVFAGAVFPLMLIAGIILCAVGWKHQRYSVKILHLGILCSASVSSVIPFNVRINGTEYFKVTLNFMDEDGMSHIIYDIVPYSLADYLSGLQASSDEVIAWKLKYNPSRGLIFC